MHGLAQNGQGAAGPSSYLSGGLCCHSCSSRYKLQKQEIKENLKVSSVLFHLSYPGLWSPATFPAAELMSHCDPQRGWGCQKRLCSSCCQPKAHDWPKALGTQPAGRIAQTKGQDRICTLSCMHWEENLNNFPDVCTWMFCTWLPHIYFMSVYMFKEL